MAADDPAGLLVRCDAGADDLHGAEATRPAPAPAPASRAAQVVMPVHWPPVTLSVWAWAGVLHGAHRKETALAAPSGGPGRPSGISMEAMPRIWSGMPSWTFSPPISIWLSSTLDAVRRVSIQPKATALPLILNWPHSLARVLVRPTTPLLPAA